MAFKFKVLITRFRSFYVGKYALVTNTVTAGTISMLSDKFSQCVEIQMSQDQAWSAERTKHMTILSTSFAPVFHYWYKFLDSRYGGRSARSISKKVFLDVAISPVFYVFYIGGLAKLKNYSFDRTISDYKNKIPLMVIADIVFWSTLQWINFLFFPPHYRIIGMKLNELAVGAVYSHIMNNNYNFEQILRKLFSKKD